MKLTFDFIALSSGVGILATWQLELSMAVWKWLQRQCTEFNGTENTIRRAAGG
jgi:hypothetical protein